MFCEKCGGQIEDSAQFCIHCGSPLAVEGPAWAQTEEAAFASQGQQAGQGAYPSSPRAEAASARASVPARQGSRAWAVVAAIAGLVLVGAGFIVGWGVLGGGFAQTAVSVEEQAPDSQSSQGTQVLPSQESSASEDSAAIAGSAESESAESSAASVQSASSTRMLDLSDPADYELINIFLSNFSETYTQEIADVSTASTQELVTFAVKHVGLNSYDQWESSESMDGWPGIPGGDSMAGGVNGMRGMRLSAGKVQEIVERYCGRSVDFEDIAIGKEPYGWCIYDDGYVYFGVTNGAGAPNGVALANEVHDNGDGTLTVGFEVYGVAAYKVGDEGLYSSTPDELLERFKVSSPALEGTAVVRFGDYNEYTEGLQLVSYSAKRV